MQTSPEEWNLVVIWEFRVAADNAQQFEAAYGPNGVWAVLFRTAKGYIRSELARDTAQRGRYLTVDYWISREAYDTFRTNNAGEYEVIDRQCENLTESEIEVGRFERT